MNQFNALHGEKPTDPSKEWNIQLTAAHFKSRTSPTKTSTMVSDIMGGLNHHDIDNGNVEVQNSEFPFEYNSESVPDLDTTPIKLIDDDEWTISWNYSIHKTMMIFWMLTYT